MAGFTETVIAVVQQHRDRQILLVSDAELRLADDDLPTLLRRKREALLVDGRVLLDEPAAVRRRRLPDFLPHADRRFVMADGSTTQRRCRRVSRYLVGTRSSRSTRGGR